MSKGVEEDLDDRTRRRSCSEWFIACADNGRDDASIASETLQRSMLYCCLAVY